MYLIVTSQFPVIVGIGMRAAVGEDEPISGVRRRFVEHRDQRRRLHDEDAIHAGARNALRRRAVPAADEIRMTVRRRRRRLVIVTSSLLDRMPAERRGGVDCQANGEGGRA